MHLGFRVGLYGQKFNLFRMFQQKLSLINGMYIQSAGAKLHYLESVRGGGRKRVLLSS
jgi:hypothetical protein